ncbi:MAG: hypothetical protein GY931_07635 [Maribacter sp.]|nr:hypothetical protein [Maribacter sp.]
MKKSFYLSIITLFGICIMHSQDSTNTDEKDRDNPSLKYDWSDIATRPYVIGKKTGKNNIDSYLNPAKTIDFSAVVGSLNYPISASNNSKMPVYEPKGIYKMRVFEIDSTKQFYLRIFKVH